jgi:hypothetical protein
MMDRKPEDAAIANGDEASDYLPLPKYICRIGGLREAEIQAKRAKGSLWARICRCFSGLQRTPR